MARRWAAGTAGLCCSLAAVAAPPRPDHVVIVIEENHSFTSVIGSQDAPFLNALASGGALLTGMYAITHPSQPNYLQFFSGSNQGVSDNSVPPGLPFSSANLGAALMQGGFSFVGYCEDLPEAGSNLAESGRYVRKHNPWVNWQSATPGPNQLPLSTNQPMTAFPADFNLLPRLAVVVPNLDNDMHDGTIAQADQWLQQRLGAYAAWCMEHNSLLIITWDEDESAERNRIPTIFYGPMVRQRAVGGTWTLHNLHRTIAEMFGVPAAGAAASVRPIAGVFAGEVGVQVTQCWRGSAGAVSVADTWIEPANPATAHGSSGQLTVDGGPLAQGLLRFDGWLGPGAGKVPHGAVVESAKVMLLTGTGGSDVSGGTVAMHRMLVGWQESSTWNSLAGGVSVNGTEAAAAAEFSLIPNVSGAWAIFDVSDWAQDVCNGGANQGFLLQPQSTDGWRPISSEASSGTQPVLEVVYRTPACSAADLASEGDPDPLAGPDGFVTGVDFDVFVLAFFKELRRFDGALIADLADGSGNGVPDGFVSGTDFDRFVQVFFAGC